MTLSLVGTTLLAVLVGRMLCYPLGAATVSELPQLEPRLFGRPLAADAKVMVLLAGWPDTHDLWPRQFITTFADEYHIVSIPTPDFDRVGLRRAWGYNFTEVPLMIARCLNNHLGPARHIDTLVAHDWGAVWAYSLLRDQRQTAVPSDVAPEGLLGRVARLVAVDIGASSREGQGVPGISHVHSLWSVPYQWLCAGLFAVGSGMSPALAQVLTNLAWPLAPYVGPMGRGFHWESHAPRPREQVQWWMGYPYYHLWRSHRFGLWPLPELHFPPVPTLFLYGSHKRAMFHSKHFEARVNATANCRTVRYDGIGHWLMHEQPVRFTRDVQAFLAE